jgi:hypothetical protein
MLSTKILESKEYYLGKQVGEIKAWCEAAGSEAKDMSLSHPFQPEDYDFLLSEAEKLAKRNKVHLYLEKSLLQSDLFKGLDLKGQWIFVIYKKQQIIDGYLALKAKKDQLVKNGKYVNATRKEIARKMGRLLGYNESTIEHRLT